MIGGRASEISAQLPHRNDQGANERDDGRGIRYRPRPDATPEAETSALASVYAFLLDPRRGKGGTRTAVSAVVPDGGPERRAEDSG